MARPKYLPPLDMFLSVSSSIFFDIPKRSIARDATNVLNRHRPRPTMTGIENLPSSGAFMIVANHHHRENMWIGWVGAMVEEAVNGIRPGRTPVRIVVTDSQRMTLFGRSMAAPFSRWMLGRVARFWEMIPIPGDPTDTVGHAVALKATLHVLKGGEPVLFFPEGERGAAYGLVEALPGTGSFIALASRRAAIIPCGFWEEGDLLCGQFAPPLSITETDDSAVREQVMVAIGRLLPEPVWGPYTTAIKWAVHRAAH